MRYRLRTLLLVLSLAPPLLAGAWWFVTRQSAAQIAVVAAFVGLVLLLLAALAVLAMIGNAIDRFGRS